MGEINKQLSIQKIIGSTIGIFGILASLINFIVGILFRNETIAISLFDETVMITFIVGLLFLVTSNIDFAAVRLFHFITILAISGLSIWDGFESFYGLGFLIIAFLVAYKYEYLKRYFRIKSIVWLLSIAILVELASRFGTVKNPGSSFIVIAFLIFFAGFFFMVYKADIDRLSSANKGLAADLLKSRRESFRLKRAMKANDEVLSKFQDAARKTNISNEEQWLTLKDEFRLTNKELMVIQQVYSSGDTNADIAYAMGVTEGTIKKHLNKILEKMEARDRLDLVVLTKNYLSV